MPVGFPPPGVWPVILYPRLMRDVNEKLSFDALTAQQAGFEVRLTAAESGLASLSSSTSIAISAINASLSLKADLVSGKVPSSQLPSYIDDVVEYANVAAFPVTGEPGKIYLDLSATPADQYRWTGTTYQKLVSAPGSTDAVPEGSVNLYFTNVRADARADLRIAAAVNVSVQAYSAKLTSLAGLTGGSDLLPYFNGSSSFTTTPFTAFGRALIATADLATLRTSLSLPNSSTAGRMARFTGSAGELGATTGLYEDGAGLVGIGNAAPSSALDLSGAATVRGMAAPSASPSGQGRVYFDSTSNTFKVSQHGGAYQDLVVPTSVVTKVGYLTVTAATDLDFIRNRVNSLDAAVVLRGSWDASSGTFPGSNTPQAGDSWIVSVTGIVDGITFNVGDRIVCLVDNANSVDPYGNNWLKLDYTDQVLSVAGRTGAITLTSSDLTDSTAFGRAFIALADSAAARSVLGLVIGTNVQAYDADLAALAALGSTGFAARTAADTWAQRSLAAPAAGFTITNPAGVAGNPTFALSNDLAALEGLSGTGFGVRSTTDTWVQRSLAQPAAGLTISNSDGVSGNPTFALANDLAALEGLTSTGFAVRTTTDTWAQRTITGTANEITIANGDGVAGNPTASLPAALTFTGKTITGGTFASPAAITGLPDPTGAQDAATKAYVDSVAAGLDAKASVRCRTTANVSISGGDIANGTTHDGVTVSTGQRIGVMANTAQAENGIYIVPASGAATRATDMDSWAEVPGAFVFVEEGTTYANSGWTCTSDVGGTLGTTAITWTQFSGAGAYTADGTTLQLTGTVFSVKDVELLALASLTSAADALPYFTGSGTASTTTLTSYARSLLDDVDASTMRTTLGLVIGTNVQAYDAELAAIAGLTSAADRLPYFTGAGTAALATFTTFGRNLVDDADATTARSTLGLVIGTDVQAYDAELAAIAGLVSAADKLPYFTGSGTASLADFTTFGRTLAATADASAARTSLGLVIGTNVQAYSSVLAGTTASFLTAQETKLGYITVTQAVDLDAIEARVNELDAAVVLKGGWDASVGTFPGAGAAQAGWSYIVTVAGTVDGVAFSVNDRVLAYADNASTTTYASNWIKLDYTDQVLSVAGRTGAVTLTASDITDSTAYGRALIALADSAALRSGLSLPNTTVAGRLARYTNTVGQQGSTTGLFEDGTGRVGVGTDTPAYPFHVFGGRMAGALNILSDSDSHRVSLVGTTADVAQFVAAGSANRSLILNLSASTLLVTPGSSGAAGTPIIYTGGDATGTNVDGGTITLRGGLPTGTGKRGHVILQTVADGGVGIGVTDPGTSKLNIYSDDGSGNGRILTLGSVYLNIGSAPYTPVQYYFTPRINTSRLQIASTYHAILELYTAVNQQTGFAFQGSGYRGGVYGDGNYDVYVETNDVPTSTGNLYFTSINGTGKVGVGIAPGTALNSKLDINGAVTFRGMAEPAVAPAGKGVIYFDSTSNKLRFSNNGGGYADIGTGSGGGGSGLTDGDYGDIVVGGGATTLTIDSAVLTTFGRTVTSAANATAGRAALGLVIGTDVQAYDGDLAAIAGLTSAADSLPYFTGAGTAALTTLTSFGRSLIDDSDATAARSTLGLVIGTNVQAYSAVLQNTTASFLTAQETKLGYLTVTGAVNLDTINSRVNDLDAAVVLKGGWAANAGTFPGSGAAQAGWSYIVTVAGTVNGIDFAVNDRVLAILDNASTSTYASNWLKLDYTDQVLSVAGRTGAVTLVAGDIGFTPTGGIAATLVSTALAELDTEKLAKAGGTMSGAIAMGSNKITGLAAGTANGDAIRYEQLVGVYAPLNNSVVFSAVYAKTTSNGYVILQPGDTTHTGYLALYRADDVRSGFIGYATNTGTIEFQAEAATSFSFNKAVNITGQLTNAGSINSIGSSAVVYIAEQDDTGNYFGLYGSADYFRVYSTVAADTIFRLKNDRTEQSIKDSGGTFRQLLHAGNISSYVMVGSGGSHAPGFVPDPPASSGTTKFLREDGTWSVPAGGGANYQEFSASGTWTKPASGTLAIIECWGGGGSGGKGAGYGGGGGSGYNKRIMLLTALGATETVTIGAGGASRTSTSAGATGGNTTFGAHLTAYGGAGGQSTFGGGGGGLRAAGSAGSGGAGNTVASKGGNGAEGATPAAAENSEWGGGGGGYSSGGVVGGNSTWGGGGGGAVSASASAGPSINGGNGGAGATTTSNNGSAGATPGGGGGAGWNGNSGAGGGGFCRVTVI